MKYLFLSVFFALSVALNAQVINEQWAECNSQGCKVLDQYYSEGSTFIWDGSCVEGKADGKGKMQKFIDGKLESTYEGTYVKGIREGFGKFSHSDGSVLECNFTRGQGIGEGTWSTQDGSFYKGNIVNYRRHGFGVMEFANGNKFEGTFNSDSPFTGKFTTAKGDVTYYLNGELVDKLVVAKKASYNPEIGVRQTEYFNSEWVRCNKTEASYYRIITYEAPNKPRGIVRDFYISGAKQSELYPIYIDYSDDRINFNVGEAYWYYENEKIRAKAFFVNNKLNGLSTTYYENGQKDEEQEFNMGIPNGILSQWYKTGKLKLLALFENGELVENKFIEYDENGSGALVFNENFDLNKLEWEVDNKINVSTVRENTLLLTTTNEEPCFRTNYLSLEQKSDFSIEATVAKGSGSDKSNLGLIFGMKDLNDFYQFVISPKGSFMIWGRFEGVQIDMVPWKLCSAINKSNASNDLKMFKFGDEYVFSINGQIVAREKYKTLRGNNCGLVVSGKGTYYLTGLTVKEFLPEEELEKQKPKQVNPSPSASNTSGEWKGNGSGFFISEKGYIATNYHVVQDAKEIQVEYYQKGIKKVYPAEVIVSDKLNDLSIIKIKSDKFQNTSQIPYVFFTNTVDVGTEVFALGYPIADVMGDEVKFTDGKISSRTGLQGDITVYQISTPIQAGNSGGPLFDNKGNLIGIPSSGLNREYFKTENVNYAIKSSYLKNLIDVLPETITIPNYTEIYNLTLTEKIKVLSEFVPIIRIK